MDGSIGLSWYQLIALLSAIVMPAYGWIFLRVIGDQSKLEARLTQHEKETREKLEELPDRYVRRDDFGQFRADIMSVLERIEAKIDSKADKP